MEKQSPLERRVDIFNHENNSISHMRYRSHMRVITNNLAVHYKIGSRLQGLTNIVHLCPLSYDDKNGTLRYVKRDQTCNECDFVAPENEWLLAMMAETFDE